MGEPPAPTHGARPLLLVLSHLRWDFVFQRPQHLLTRAARDYDVVFVEEPLCEGDETGVRDGVRAGGVRVVQPLLPAPCDPAEALLHQGEIVERIVDNAGNRPVYLWYYAPMAVAFGHRIDADLVIFDKMDELAAFAFAPPELKAREASLMDMADLVFTGGASLYEAARGRNPSVHCFPSSIEAAHFGRARDAGTAEPADLVGIKRPRIGFFGVIDERIDLDLVRDTAALRPDWQFVMIGPTVKIDPDSRPRAENIHWLGGKQYAELPDYMAHWDLGWMPFALNESTRFISPTKTPEFLAAGLPLVSTPIHDVVEPYGRQGLVDIAASPDQMVGAMERMLADASGESRARRMERVDAHLAGNSWDETWAGMKALIEAAAAAKSAARAPVLKEASRV